MKIQLKHPAGKKAINMDKNKYEILKKILLHSLHTKGELTHKEILQNILEEFAKSKIKFEGSVEWYMEWVKLDMEARKEIKRSENSPVKFSVSKFR